MARPVLLVNATELLRQPGRQQRIAIGVPLTELDAAHPHLSGDVDVDVTLESTLDAILVTGRLAVAWSDECRRCLRPIAERLLVDVDERYVEADPDGRPSRIVGSLGSRPVDPEAFPIEHGQIDLAPMARAEVLLAVPEAPLCRPDCAGLCPTCGADLAAGPCGCDTEVLDDRWAALGELKLEE